MKTFRLLIVSLLLATSASAQHHRGERRGGDYSPTVYLISVHEVDTIYNCGGCAAQQAAARNRNTFTVTGKNPLKYKISCRTLVRQPSFLNSISFTQML